MDVLKASMVYLMSLVASKVLRYMTPIEFEDKPCGAVYNTRVDEGSVSYVMKIEQWCMCSKTRLKIFNTCNKYYIANVDILIDGAIIGKRKDFFTAPIKGFLTRTKLPHAIIALAAINKAKLEVSNFEKPA